MFHLLDFDMNKTQEPEWMQSIRNIFDDARRRTPPQISQSEVETLLIGLTSQTRHPTLAKPLSASGEKAREMLQGYLDIMKKKKKHWLPVK
jgi:hypothetical protein